MPPGVLPFAILLLTAEVPGSATRASLPTVSAGETTAHATDGAKFQLFLHGAFMEGLLLPSDGEFQSGPTASGGIDGRVLWSSGSFRIGLGLRYELAYVPAAAQRSALADHFIYAPLLLGGAHRFSKGSELEALFGVGVAAGLIAGGTTSDRSSYLRAIGAGVELSVTYWFPVHPGLDLSVGGALNVAVLEIQNAGTYYSSFAARAVLPLRIGARWSL
jgi:hypothetical protein